MRRLTQRLPDAVLCLNGLCPGPEFFSYFSSLPLVVADGAAHQLLACDIRPDIIIGDMDSFRHEEVASLLLSHTVIHTVPDQNSTDFEKCLEYCLCQNFVSLLVCGIHGGDMEHTLNNWSIVMRYSERMNLCLYDAGRYGISLKESVAFPVIENDLVSLIPQPQVLLTTEGLKWPLQHEVLELGRREGARNRAVSDTVRLDIHAGSLLLFLPSHLPEMIVIE